VGPNTMMRITITGGRPEAGESLSQVYPYTLHFEKSVAVHLLVLIDHEIPQSPKPFTASRVPHKQQALLFTNPERIARYVSMQLARTIPSFLQSQYRSVAENPDNPPKLLAKHQGLDGRELASYS
jgi:hypothetical protein